MCVVVGEDQERKMDVFVRCRKAFSVKSQWSLKPGLSGSNAFVCWVTKHSPSRRNEPGLKALDCHEGLGCAPEGTREPWKALEQRRQTGADTNGM